MSGHRNPSKKWNALLLVLGILMLGTVAGRYTMHRQTTDSTPSTVSVEKSAAPIALTGVRHTAIKDGHKAWSLAGESAEYQVDQKEVDFKQLHAVFYRADGKDIDLRADAGAGRTDSNDLEVTGDVVVKTSQELLKTETLEYSHEKRMFISRTPVIVRSASIMATADRMTYELMTGLIHLDGNVLGTIGKSIGP